MDLLREFVSLFLHLDTHLSSIIQQFGLFTYVILFLIVFCETGLVVTPFLPGDSLLFAAGAFAAKGDFNLVVLLVLLSIAAIVGDTVNYWIGKYIGKKAFTMNGRFLKHEHLVKTQQFYEKHGPKTIIIARFVPIVRTFAPFVAGIGSMDYKIFAQYNVIGGLIWVVLFTIAGYFFGNLPFVEKNFTLVIFAIIVISIIPGVVEWYRGRRK